MKHATVSQLFKIIGGNPAPKEDNAFSTIGLPFVKMKDLGKFHFSNNLTEIENRISDKKAAELNLKVIKKGSILLPRSGSVALNHRAILGTDAYMVSHICALEVIDKKVVNNIYAYYYLRTISMDRITKKTTGLDAITFQDLGKIKIPLPPIDDQIRIATILTWAEKLIAKRKESIKALDELLKSTFLEMFGDPVRNEKGWSFSPLGEKLNLKHGFAFKGEFFSNTGEYVLLTPGNFFEEGGYRDRGDKQKYYQGEFPQEYILKKGDLLIAMTEQAPGLLGSPLIVPDSNKFLHNQRLGLIILKKDVFNRLYLFHLFNHPNIRRLIYSKAIGSKVRHTSPSKIEEIKVSIPPLPLQTQFAAIFGKVEVLKAKYTQSLIQLENLYGSLSQRAFKGELDLSKVPVDVIVQPKPVEHIHSLGTKKNTPEEISFEDFGSLFYPATETDKTICAAALAIIEQSNQLSSMNHLDLLMLVTHPDWCKMFLDPKEHSAFDRVLKLTPDALFINTNSSIRWKDCRDYLEQNKAIVVNHQVKDQIITLGLNSVSIKDKLPSGVNDVAKFAIKAMGRIIDLRKDISKVTQEKRNIIRIFEEQHRVNQLIA